MIAQYDLSSPTAHKEVTAAAPLGEKIKIKKPEREEDIINIRNGILTRREVLLGDNSFHMNSC